MTIIYLEIFPVYECNKSAIFSRVLSINSLAWLKVVSNLEVTFC